MIRWIYLFYPVKTWFNLKINIKKYNKLVYIQDKNLQNQKIITVTIIGAKHGFCWVE
jgi:hypothetical protein